MIEHMSIFYSIKNILDFTSPEIHFTPSIRPSPVTALHACTAQWRDLIFFKSKTSLLEYFSNLFNCESSAYILLVAQY